MNYDFCGCWLYKKASKGFNSFLQSQSSKTASAVPGAACVGHASTYRSEIIVVNWLAVGPWEFRTQGTCLIGHIKTFPWTCSKKSAKRPSVPFRSMGRPSSAYSVTDHSVHAGHKALPFVDADTLSSNSNVSSYITSLF